MPLLPQQAQGVVKDLDADLLQHLAQGTAFLQVSTKAHPNGEMRGRVGSHGGRTPILIPTAACSQVALLGPARVEGNRITLLQGPSSTA